MPVNIKQTHYSFDDDFDLNSFFGFIEVEVTCFRQ